MPAGIRQLAEDRYKNFFCEHPEHPALEGKFVRDVELEREVYKVSAGGYYRALAIVEEVDGVRSYIWYWIGSHEAYNRRV